MAPGGLSEQPHFLMTALNSLVVFPDLMKG